MDFAESESKKVIQRIYDIIGYKMYKIWGNWHKESEDFQRGIATAYEDAIKIIESETGIKDQHGDE